MPARAAANPTALPRHTSLSHLGRASATKAPPLHHAACWALLGPRSCCCCENTILFKLKVQHLLLNAGHQDGGRGGGAMLVPSWARNRGSSLDHVWRGHSYQAAALPCLRSPTLGVSPSSPPPHACLVAAQVSLRVDLTGLPLCKAPLALLGCLWTSRAPTPHKGSLKKLEVFLRRKTI